MAGGGGGHGDELQDDVKVWCVRGEKGADTTEGAINVVETQLREAEG